MGFKPMTRYFTASKTSEKNAYLSRELMDYQRRKPTTFLLLWDLNP